MFNKLVGLAFPSGYIFPFLLASSLEHGIRVSFPCTFYHSCTLFGMHSLGMAMSVLYFLYLAWPYPWDIGNVCFTFLLCVITLYMMYVYLYMLVCGWLCTLYDGLLWLRERPSLVMSARDLVEWVCAQGYCYRCIFVLYCVHDHHDVIILIHVIKWHQFPRVCDAHQYGASPFPYSHSKSLVGIAFYVLWHTWGEALLDFRHKNKVKFCRIFVVEIRRLFQTHQGSINRDHTLFETKP